MALSSQAINRSRDGYLRIKDGLVSKGEIQKMEDKAHVHAFFLAYHEMRTYRWWLLFRPTDLECYPESKVSLERVKFYAHLLISFVLMDNLFFSFGTRIRQVQTKHRVSH
jgi:hypothetical protein